MINDRCRGSDLIPDFDHFIGLFRKDAESIDRDLKSGNNNLIEGAKRKIRLAIFDDHILKRSNNKEMLAKKEARRAKENIKNSKVGKNAADFYAKHEKGVKIGGGVAAGTALAAGLAVGAKKLADKKKEQQKEFARADYEGLNAKGREELRKKRSEYAKKLNDARNFHTKDLTLDKFKPGRTQGSETIIKVGDVTSKVNVKSSIPSNNPFTSKFNPVEEYDAITPRGRHKKILWDNHLIEANKASKLMKDEVQAQDKFTRGANLTAEEIKKGREQRKFLAGIRKEQGRTRKEILNAEKRRERLAASEESIMKHSKLADELRAKKALGKRLKKAGYVGLGVAGAAGLAYGGKKLYDRYKKNNESENKD